MAQGAILIAGTGSGVGKTSVTLGLVAALKRQGLTVQTFKIGPDFLDPTWLALASGRPCYNLDGWMCGEQYVRNLFAEKSADADIAIIEGVMGLFDGASPVNAEGSSAEIAHWLGLPVLLVVNSHGVARTLAATVSGFCSFEAGVRIGGIIANQSGSGRHADWLAQSLSSASLPPLAGAIPRNALPTLPSRHLGLVTAGSAPLTPALLQELAEQIEQHLQLDVILELAAREHRLPPLSLPEAGGESAWNLPSLDKEGPGVVDTVRIGIARDEAFHFYYPDNLEALSANGAELVLFSPIHDTCLPPGLDGIYLGGGYPEEHAARLASNSGMLDAIRAFIASNRPVYAECGGLMYLSRGIELLDGSRQQLVAALPFHTRMLPKRKALGYVEVTLQQETLLGSAGQVLRGHEFHYSEIIEQDPTIGAPPYQTVKRNLNNAGDCGYQQGNLLASYIHLQFAARPEVAAYFIQTCRSCHAIKPAYP
ncbi:cobyrinate a,c-diamide synthase [Trichlorobacter lovleyi]|jgi:hydrogenobyrinic acid a,c-diamide synthase (glutamine-hydrolysing) (EC 6.3.5.9)/cobyrinate a,c-diamide synthase (EC 6.3.5.-)|uniref:Cobyrinate a,c-diamide synthase n=1 Tax=Trichlorobacter lovleyi (strain ATCC BAA-1151 / DSM 17278 / SZ) TaxID=398767 RepID=B3EBS3_TRIL1|nr:cobyrinate a,c-diamide synthase [Trichlorobacter lovleyi]ACD97355.1 cobyrinic acid a,c-diamide synthase [Trichlorobacter lovleyi SZ]